MKLFADDSELLSIIKNVENATNLQKDLKAVNEWTNTSGMRLNLEKS